MNRRAFLICGLMMMMAGLVRAENVPAVGIEGRLVSLLPGTMLLAKAVERAAAVNVRIAGTRPHGTLIEYDLRYIGLVPGDYDLRSYLIRQDGSTLEDLPALAVKIQGILPAKHLGELLELKVPPFSRIGGYRVLLGSAVAVWVLLGVPLFVLGRRRRAGLETTVSVAGPSLAERMRPLVEAAMAGELSTEKKAQLERMLLGHWRERMKLENLASSEAMARLRENPEAGALLRTLEDWLHRRPGTAQFDLECALAPYARAACPVPAQANA